MLPLYRQISTQATPEDEIGAQFITLAGYQDTKIPLLPSTVLVGPKRFNITRATCSETLFPHLLDPFETRSRLSSDPKLSTAISEQNIRTSSDGAVHAGFARTIDTGTRVQVHGVLGGICVKNLSCHRAAGTT